MTKLLLGGRVYSPSHPDATAMAVRDGVVAWLGSDEVALAQFPDAQRTDLAGGFVTPAFVDSHVHLAILPEVHDRYATHERLSAHGFWTYDFVLPGLLLNAFETGDTQRLRAHAGTPHAGADVGRRAEQADLPG